MQDLIEKAKSYFYTMINDFGEDPYHLLGHVPLVAKQAEQCLKKFPNANSEITLLGAWLHDIGHYPLPEEKDHAVQGEERARKFLEKHSVEPHIIGQICHCVRAHRNKDVPPVSIEAKIVAFSDSASHLVGSMYMDMVQQGRGELVFDKMERDYKDLALLEGMQAEYEGLYVAWKALLAEMKKFYT